MPQSEAADVAALLTDYVPRAEYEAALDAISQASRETEEFRTQDTQRSSRLKELEGKVRGRAYRDAFEKARKEDGRKVKDEFADAVFKLLDLKQDADEPNDRDLRNALDGFLKDNKGFVDDGKSSTRQPLEPGEGAVRGKSIAPGEPQLRVKMSELNNASFMRQNQAAVHAASKAGLLVIDDN